MLKNLHNITCMQQSNVIMPIMLSRKRDSMSAEAYTSSLLIVVHSKNLPERPSEPLRIVHCLCKIHHFYTGRFCSVS